MARSPPQPARRMAEKREAYAAQPYDVPPPPIQEVDAGSFTFGEPERLPPQYDEFLGLGFSNVQASALDDRTGFELDLVY
ncbi:hypothetical protein B0H13DRAFT_2356391 [Mycena leptocephala]|nr:hypothetical protein B0H13DRAFT_2356391 [Mycena leptocephala]